MDSEESKLRAPASVMFPGILHQTKAPEVVLRNARVGDLEYHFLVGFAGALDSEKHEIGGADPALEMGESIGFDPFIVDVLELAESGPDIGERTQDAEVGETLVLQNPVLVEHVKPAKEN